VIEVYAEKKVPEEVIDMPMDADMEHAAKLIQQKFRLKRLNR
jgi:hypothetical protein